MEPSTISLIVFGAGLLLGAGVTAFWIGRHHRASPSGKSPSAPAGPPRAWLRDLSGFTGQALHDVAHRATRISRLGDSGTGRVRTLRIRDNAISRQHAMIEYRDGQGYWITDSGSVNGTYVNDERLVGTRRLAHGDMVRFARFEFEFVAPETSRRKGQVPHHTRTDHGMSRDERTVLRPPPRP